MKASRDQEWQKPERLNTKDEKQTIVFIALEDLTTDNGFFISLKQGQDICVDSKADILFLPTSGGLGICFALLL